MQKFKISPVILENFLNRIEEGYRHRHLPYHNNSHGADVAQTMHCVLYQTGLMKCLTDLEILAALIGSLVHDYDHTGTTNNFLIRTGAEVALIYNDRSVQENHHISAAFRIMKEDDCNVLSNLSCEEYRKFRTLIIEMVLATDMSCHFQILDEMKSLLALPSPKVDKTKLLALLLHCCDISQSCKKWHMHRRWALLISEEFFHQGDLERELGLPPSPLCDRDHVTVAETTARFIDFIVVPCMTVLSDVLEHVLAPSASKCKNLNAIPDPGCDETSPLQSISEGRESTGATIDVAPQTNTAAAPQTSTAASTQKLSLLKPWFTSLAENQKMWEEEITGKSKQIILK